MGERDAFRYYLHNYYKPKVLGYGPAQNLTEFEMRIAYQDWKASGMPKGGKPRGSGKRRFRKRDMGGGILGLFIILDSIRGTAAAPGVDGYQRPPGPSAWDVLGGILGAISDPLGIYDNEVRPLPDGPCDDKSPMGDFAPVAPWGNPNGGYA